MFKNTAVSKKKKHLTHIRSSICNSHLVTSKWNSWSTVGTQAMEKKNGKRES